METIYGYLERITFYNEENHFIVARLKEKGKKELTTIVGNLSGVNPGESLKLCGNWVYNKRFGEQFQVEKFETLVPATVHGIEKYLGCGAIKGIGPVMARRIVKTFGLDTLNVIEDSPQELARIEGIGPKRVAMIADAWVEQKEVKQIMIFLQGHGVSAAYSAKIFKRYGQASIEIVQNNPYRLAADVRGIGFITADQIARNMGIDPSSIMRAEEGTLYVLRQLMEEGHVYYPYQPLMDATAEMLKVERETVAKAIAKLAEDQRIVFEDLNQTQDDFQPNYKAVYLTPFFVAESNLARRLTALNQAESSLRSLEAEKAVSWAEKKLGVRLADRQKEAVALSVQSKVLIITGGPGTGKTTIIRAITNILQALNLRILMAAPTGRAAKRMLEATGIQALTIHRLLEFSPRDGSFKRNQDHPLETDAVIIDESSMIDTILMYDLVKALPPSCSLILVGDVNQLPSVGPGNVLRDMIASGRFQVVTLDKIFRQSEESRIVVNAHRINRGEFPDIRNPIAGRLSDFYFIEEEDPEKAVGKIVQLCRERIPRSMGHHPVRDIQVLSPMYRGIVGVENLNFELQKALNPGGRGVVRGSQTFRVKDKVMQVVNNYDKEVFNGDIGWINAIDFEDQQLKIDFDGRTVTYDFSELEDLQMAYAISIHKSQGSEYPAVVLPIMIQHFMLLQRNLIYTGITRGKKLLIMVGSKKALAIAIKNNQPMTRYTRLRERLEG